MIVTVDVPNVNLELACFIRDVCSKWGIEDYTIQRVEWTSALKGYFSVIAEVRTRHAFTVSKPYLDWDQRKQTTLEVTK